MKVVFMGTPDFAVPTLDALIKGGHDVLAVVTQPDKPKGRGKAVLMTPVKEKAVACGILVYQPARVRDESFLQVLRDLAPDVIVTAAFGQILSKTLLEIPKYGCVNVHASLLPMYRGAAPINWVIINGEKETGITTMQMDTGIDTGDILEQRVVAIAPDETAGSLSEKLSIAGGELILSTLKKLEEGTLAPVAQEGETCYVKMLHKAQGDIDWTKDAASIERLVRGLNPWPSAYTQYEDKTVKIWAADVVACDAEDAAHRQAGCVWKVTKDRIYVQTGKGSLAIREIQLQGKKRMDTASFLRGFSMEPGVCFQKGC
ncbi:MAG: methionyl-tRNA formyltransferase [bacterium]|nr:methionyl-tRNA formyltransferase [bacterium]